MNAGPGFVRLWLGRLFWGLVVTIPLGTLLLVLLMISAELRGLDHARTGVESANSLLSAAMRAGKPESVPETIRQMAQATGTTIILFRNDGTPAYSDSRALDRIKAYTSVPDAWKTAPHSPNLFLWPPSALPSSLVHEVDRIFSLRSAHLVTDLSGQASPLAVNGGYAVWTASIPNRTSCARCHGFDREVLGHWVAVSSIAPMTGSHGTLLWGFWPLPGVNQKILLGGTLSLALFSIFVVSLAETWTLRRGFRGKKEKPVVGKKGSETPSGQFSRETESQGEEESGEMTVSHEGWEELHRRLETLDRQVLALADEIPRAGILPQKHPDNVIAVHATLGELLADWSDRFELGLQELEAHPALASDPVWARYLEKAREFRSQAVSYADMAVQETEEKSYGALKAPFFESLSEDQKDWTDRLRAVLGHLHAEIRSMEGISKTGLARTEAPKGEANNGKSRPGS